MNTTVLKPGLLVALHSTVKGGVNYKRIEIEPDHTTTEGERRAAWQTERTIPDPQEFERATVARGKARSLVASVCCSSSFGLLCPSEREPELQAAIVEARKVAEAHNETAALSRVAVFVIVGRIAQDDAEAARAIAAEVRGLVAMMREGVATGDVEAIREAANKARALGGMLSEDVAGKVADAIKEARSVAREITRRVAKSGEQAAVVVASIKLRALEESRFAFLDMEGAEAQRVEAPARGLDLAPAQAPERSAAPQPFALELA